MTLVEDLQLARRAYEGRAWTETAERLAAVDEHAALAVEDLVRWGTATYLRGDSDQSRRLLQRAYDAATSEAAGPDPRAAARCAFWLGMQLIDAGQLAVAGGWFAQAWEHLERVPQDCPERGYLMLPQALMRLEAGDLAGAREAVEQLRACGQRHQVPDLVVVGTHFLGRVQLYTGEIAAGLTLLDRAMTGLLSSRLTPMLAGQVYCSTVEACQELGDLDRVRQWTAALVQWCDEQPDLVPYTGQCAVHRGQLMALDGALDDACQEFRLACERYQRVGAPFAAGLARYEEGEVHRLRGEYDSARGSYDEAAGHGHDGQPGRALLALAIGDGGTALPGLERALAEALGPIRRLRVLPAVARIATDAGDLDRAAEAVTELAGIAEASGVPAVRARARAAEGALALARGQPAPALPVLREAHRLWAQVHAPYEEARVRVDIGRACGDLGDAEGARVEWLVAQHTFAALGARPDERRVTSLLGLSPGPHGLTRREVQVLELVAAGLTNRQIASRLYLSQKTVSRHLGNIFVKLGVRSRTAAAAYAFRNRPG